MTFNNGKRIVVFRLLSLISTVIFVIYMLLAYFAAVLGKYLTSTQLTIITIVITTAFIIVILWPAIRQYRYIYFTDDGRSVVLRWYTIGLMSGDNNSIEIPKESFAGYEITRKLNGLYSYITLYQIFQNRKVSFPPVSISALDNKEIRKVTEALDSYR
jgi:hypothetical protein